MLAGLDMKLGKFSRLFVVFSILCFSSIQLTAKEITDMSGKNVTVPDKITRIFSVSPAVTYILYAIDPDLIVGLNAKIRDSERPYLRKTYQDLPILGGSFRNGLTLNMETMLKVKPDVLVVWKSDGGYDKKDADKMASLNIPVVSVDVDNLNVYADTFILLGKVLNRERRANELADYTKKALNEVKNAVSLIPADRRRTVYSAQMKDGLTSSCETSWHAALIPMAGGINPVKCVSGVFTGEERLSMEQILLFNPDVIVAHNGMFVSDVYKDKMWQDIKAVKTKRVFLLPRDPGGWFGGPSSFMGILGLQWLTGCIYPEYYHKDIEKEAQYFIRLFFGIDLPKEKIKKIISGE